MKMKYVLPLVIFLALAIFLMVGLNRDPREVPSPLIGKPAPEFSLPRLDDPNKVVSKKDMLGQVWLLNVCPPGAVPAARNIRPWLRSARAARRSSRSSA